jgi:uridine kinase
MAPTHADPLEPLGKDCGVARSVGRIIEAILAAREPVLVGIDGQGGAGKSVLARMLARRLPVSSAVVEGDDFYSDLDREVRAAFSPSEAYERNFDWRRLLDQVLLPARGAVTQLRYQRYDWDLGRRGEWVELPLPVVVIVEGVYTLRRQLRDVFDIKVWVDAPKDVRHLRMRARHEGYDDAARHLADRLIDAWEAAEAAYITEERPRDHADIVTNTAQRIPTP